MALVLIQWNKELQRAESLLKEVLSYRIGQLGSKHSDTGLVYVNLGAVYNMLRQPENAKNMTAKAVEVLRQHSSAQFEFARALNNLAWFQGIEGNLKEAIKNLREANEVASRLFDESNPQQAVWMASLGVMIARQKFAEGGLSTHSLEDEEWRLFAEAEKILKDTAYILDLANVYEMRAFYAILSHNGGIAQIDLSNALRIWEAKTPNDSKIISRKEDLSDIRSNNLNVVKRREIIKLIKDCSEGNSTKQRLMQRLSEF
jgi:tetratricopeptide (TPR) repeat protein